MLAIDLGLSADRTAAALVHRTTRGIRLEQLRVWQGTKGSPVQITSEIEPFMHECVERFTKVRLVMDPWQAKSTLERFQYVARIEPFTFTGGRIDEMTRNLYALAHSGQLELFPDPGLERELLDVRVIEKEYGLRIDHRRGMHDDRVIALGMGAYVAMRMRPWEPITMVFV